MPSSDSEAKGRLSAYQRWEMTSFDENRPSAGQPGEARSRVSAESIAAAKSEMEKIRLRSQKEGFNKGFEEGHQAGLTAGLNEMQQQLTAIAEVGNQFGTALKQAETVLSQEVLDLALDLAKAMLKSALEIDPALVIPIVEQAIASLPTVQQPAQVFLSTKDAALVKNQIGAELARTGWSVVADPHLRQGDCRVETARNQINATMQTRWQQLSEALGRNNHWHEPRPERKP
jgi:flagellar assembly protein FliH